MLGENYPFVQCQVQNISEVLQKFVPLGQTKYIAVAWIVEHIERIEGVEK